MGAELNIAEVLGKQLQKVSNSGTDGREQIEYIDIDRLDADTKNFYQLSELDALAANIELIGLQQPLRVRVNPEAPDRFIIVSGHRRRAALQKLVDEGQEKFRSVPCIRDTTEGSAAMQELRLIYANSDTRKMGSADLAQQAKRIEELLYQLKEQEGVEFPGRMRDHVAEICKVSKSKLARLKVIRENLIPPLKKVWEKGKMNESIAYSCAKRNPSLQKQLIEYSKECSWYTTPDSWYENTVESRLGLLETEANLKCKKGSSSGLCDNTEKRLKQHASGHVAWNAHCKNGKCCSGCPTLATCRSACPHLADEIASAKASRKALQAKQAADQAAHDRPRTDPITALWKRFSEVRHAAGLSMDDYLKAVGIHNDGKIGKRYEAYERGERIKADTGLPYCGGYGFSLYNIQSLQKVSRVLGVSLDYLLCRTDDPKGMGGQSAPAAAAQAEGWLPLQWLSGKELPQKEGQMAVGKFQPPGAGHPLRTIVLWRTGRWCFPNGSTIDAECVGWFPLPDEEETNEGT